MARQADPSPITTRGIKRAYQTLFDARLNAVYFNLLLKRYQSLNLAVEIAMAIGASSTIASLALFNTPGGKALTAVLAAVATLLTAVKPVLKLSRKIEQTSVLWARYKMQASELRQINREIGEHRGLTKGTRRRLDACCKRLHSLEKFGDPDDRKLLAKAETQVKREIRWQDFYWDPEEFITENTAVA